MSITPVDTLQFGTLNGDWIIYKTGLIRNDTDVLTEYIYLAFTSAPQERWGAIAATLLNEYNVIYIDGINHDAYIAAGFTRVDTVPAEIRHFADVSGDMSPWYMK